MRNSHSEIEFEFESEPENAINPINTYKTQPFRVAGESTHNFANTNHNFVPGADSIFECALCYVDFFEHFVLDSDQPVIVD